MPDLPTFTVSDTQAQRILNAFGSVQNYKDWLSENIKSYVFHHERRQIMNQVDAEVTAKQNDIETNLDI